jgi:hypothetical protein
MSGEPSNDHVFAGSFEILLEKQVIPRAGNRNARN